MRRIIHLRLWPVVVAGLLFFLISAPGADAARKEVSQMKSVQDDSMRRLPAPVLKGKMSLEEVLKKRESLRDFSSTPLTDAELSQLLWATQGKTRGWGGRTAPSAGALYPLEIYVVLPEGVFHYSPDEHRLARTAAGDLRGPLASAALDQACVREAPAAFVIAAVYERTAWKYSGRAERYVKIEAGHAGQNLLLQATALGLGAVPVGAFHDDQVHRVLALPKNHEPLYLIPVGRKR